MCDGVVNKKKKKNGKKVLTEICVMFWLEVNTNTHEVVFLKEELVIDGVLIHEDRNLTSQEFILKTQRHGQTGESFMEIVNTNQIQPLQCNDGTFQHWKFKIQSFWS